ncbi:hypothetical protein [Luteipulveratus mongoliensis]|uniref:Uncharacterized protein n=1 Tax=Luteipulveratus mongoliensis TaxID=571913 RepID=A0A0K1JLN9_9MICO|nr:hypothetical protein [Luteipulveratus mongoliensis]AKU17495.1 hypothetical protein VV02_19360 [Luteipulveratus mongoliensis]
MEVTFRRTGERRYAVEVRRERAEDLIMSPAPGYDAHLPHDMVHFMVEQHWGLRDGVYGQVAAGGDAGTFHPLDAPTTKRWRKQTERRNALSGQDIGRSEQLAAVMFARWCTVRLGKPEPAWFADGARRADVSEEDTQGCLPALDVVAARWETVGIGESMSIPWPWPER